MNAANQSGVRLFGDLRKDGDDRSDFQRDRDLILYSSALQRLASTTQVASAESGHVFHNRLTHTLQVAQAGRRLAEKLIIRQPELAEHHAIDPDVVEAACLAHDIGHPPFGHLAEEELNRLVDEAAGGFEGNAQSFRIVTALALRSEEYSGLNLTHRTLQAILKYPWTFSCRPEEKKKKWGAYDTELKAFEFAIGHTGGGPVARSAEAELMDWADDLTYAIHDAEDFYRAGLIPLHMLKPLPKASGTFPFGRERETFLQYVWERRSRIEDLQEATQEKLEEILDELLFMFRLSGPYLGYRQDRANLRVFTSYMVSRYINGLHLADQTKDCPVHVDSELKKEVALLKQLTWFYVIEAPGLAVQQYAQRNVVRYLFEVFLGECKKFIKDCKQNQPCSSPLIPPYYIERLKADPDDDKSCARAVADLIAGMTESQAILMYQRLKGITSSSALEKLIV